MPRIEPGQIRNLAKSLAQDGTLTEQDVKQLVDTAMQEGTLGSVAKSELREVLNEYRAVMDSTDTHKKLQAFLAMPTGGVRNLSHALQKDDGVIDSGDADKLLALVNKDGRVSGNEKYSLAAMMVANRMTPEAKAKIDLALGREVTVTPGPARPLDASGSQRPVFLSASGFFVEDAALDKPRTLSEAGSGLFRIAEIVDDAKTSPLAGIPLADRRKVMDNLGAQLTQVAPGSVPAGMTDKQAAQMRSAGATVLMELVETAGTTGDELALKQEALTRFISAFKAEQNPVLRDSMAWNLERVLPQLPQALRAEADTLVKASIPSKPPYEEWFANGNHTLNVSWTTGPDEEFFPGTIQLLEKQGYKAEGTAPSRGPATMVKTMRNPQGEEFQVRIRVQINNSSIFKPMNDKDMHIVGYDGHSDIGRSVPGSLRNAPGEVGKKLIFTGLCAGKDNIHNMREKFPDAQILTTFNSSYFNTEDRAGGKVMTRSENFNVLMQLVDGAVKQADWNTINNNIRDKAVLFPWSHVMPGGTNYISPVHTQIRRKVLDTDHDGQADYLDKFANFDTFKPAVDTAREWQAIPPSRDAKVLDGTVVHLAAQALNTATGYNNVTQPWKKQNIIGNGFFTPAPGEKAIVKFERSKVDGQDVLLMKVNANHAHMSVESLRAAAHFQFIQDTAADTRLSAVDAKLMGLTFAAFSIMYDEGRWGRDDAIWAGLLQHLGLPADLSMEPIRTLLDAEHHDYSGNTTHVRQWKAQLPQSVLDRLAA